MNRLVHAHGYRVVGIATLWLLTTSNLPAQFQMPSGSTAVPKTTETSPAQPSAAARASDAAPAPSVKTLLDEANAAINRRDFHNAVQKFRQASAARQTAPQLAGAIAETRSRLETIGIDSALLSLPPTAAPAAQMQRLPDVSDAQALPASTPVAERKKQALRLVAIGRAALDRGDAATALRAARQAESLQVPDSEFAAGEPRVWQLLLDAESVARRSGVALTSGQSDGTTGVTTIATDAENQPGGLQQSVFNADGQIPRLANGQVQQVQNTQPIPVGQAGRGETLFREGMKALGEGDSATARAKFKEAWKYESQLEPAVRNQLKDKLTLLQPTRMPIQNASPNTPLTPMQRAEQQAQEQTRRLFREVTAELAKTEQIKVAAPLDALDQLERLRRRVDGSELDDASKRSISVMVDRAIADQKKYIEANRAKIELELQNEAIRTEMATEQARQSSIDEEVSSMVDTFNSLMQEQRYEEAYVIAKQVQELLPDSPIAISMKHTSRMGTRLMMDKEVSDAKELGVIDSLIAVDRSAIPPNPDLPMTLPEAQAWETLSRRRLMAQEDVDSRLSMRELEIRSKLTTPVTVKYDNRPLIEVLDELRAMTGVPIVIDDRALAAVRVTPETPVSLPALDDISLKSALNLILNKMELTYVIENDVLSITSMEAKRSKVYPKTYRVTDLVTPIPNFTSSYEDGLAGALRAAYQMSSPQADVQVMPVSMTDLGTGMARSMSPTNMSPEVLGQYHAMGAGGGFGMNNPPMSGGAAGGGSFADFQSLIDLIQTTVVPDTWEVLGGPSTMAPYPQNLSLVISTTSEVHDQIADLLESLRRLQNLQITIEVRFITLADTFAEQIGVDFDVQFDDNVTTLPTDDSGPSVTIGFDGINGTPTPDLDIRFNNGSFGLTPPFGAAGLGTPSTIGFAILSDIEAFFFLQAAQADNRSNVMQAPKVTLFDGQFASINDQSQSPFVISITPVVGDFAVAQQPVIVVLNEGTQLNVQGIVSDDKRFVRLTLVPFFSQIGEVDTFTFEGRRTTRNTSRDEEDSDGDGDVDQVDEEEEEDIIEGTTVQLPTFAFTSVSTTVSVPDGGTILLGGIKRLSEGRTERGVPILSKIPYVSRLFRNVSAGRDAQSLMLMVTPRIIIQEEEEVAQTGFDPTQR